MYVRIRELMVVSGCFHPSGCWKRKVRVQRHRTRLVSYGNCVSQWLLAGLMLVVSYPRNISYEWKMKTH